MKIILNKYVFILVLFAAQITSFTACDVKKNNADERWQKLFFVCSATDGPCDVQIPAGPQTYKIIVFGSREPEIKQTIADFLNLQSDMAAVATNSDNCLTDSVLSNFNVAVDYDHNGMLPEPQDALKRFVTNGGRIIALHHAIYEPCVSMPVKHDSYGAYIHTLSARGVDIQFINGPYQVILTDPTHPVFNSLPTDGTVHYESSLVAAGDYPYHTINVSDERFYGITFTQSDIHVLLSTIHNGASYDIGWYRTDGAGKVFYYQMGHLQEMFTVPWYQQLIINSIRYP